MKEKELSTNLLKSSKFKPKALNSSVESIAKVKENVDKSLNMKKTCKEEERCKKSASKSTCNGSKLSSSDSHALGANRSSSVKSNQLTSSQEMSSSLPKNSMCSRCKKKRVCNVRIQCKMDQYLSSKISSMRKELSLSLRMPRLPLPPYELSHLKYGKFFRLEDHSNGGGKVLRLYWDEITNLPSAEKNELAAEFLEESFR